MYLCSTPVPSSGEEFRQVKCDIHLTSAALKPGAIGEIVVSFAPEEGMHINTDPAVEFEFEKNPLVHFTGRHVDAQGGKKRATSTQRGPSSTPLRWTINQKRKTYPERDRALLFLLGY